MRTAPIVGTRRIEVEFATSSDASTLASFALSAAVAVWFAISATREDAIAIPSAMVSVSVSDLGPGNGTNYVAMLMQ